MESTIHLLWASSQRERIWAPKSWWRLGVRENSSLKIKKKKIYLSIRLRGNELTWDLASSVQQPYPLSEQRLPWGWKRSPEVRSERRKRELWRKPSSLFYPSESAALKNLTFPENDTMCPREGPRSRQHQREGLGHPVPGPALPDSEEKVLRSSAVAAAPWASPKCRALNESFGTVGTVNPILQIRKLRVEWEHLPQST